MLRSISLLLLALVLPIPSALAQEGSHQGVYFTTPSGWTSGMQEGHFILAPTDITEETAVVVVLYGAEKLSGKPLEDWFSAKMASDLNPQLKVLTDSAIQSNTSGGLKTLSTGRTVQDAGGGVRLQIYYAISDGKQAGHAMVVTASEAAINKYMGGIQALFQSLRFTKAPNPAATASGVSDGVWDSEQAPSPAAGGAGESGKAPTSPGSARAAQPTASPGGGSDAPNKFGNVVYATPPGWAEKRYAEGVALSPRQGLQGDETLTLFILAGKTAGNLEEEFQAAWQEVCNMLGAQSMRTVYGNMYESEGVKRSRRGWEFMRGEGGAFNDQQRFTVSLFLVKVEERIERVAIISREIMVNLITTNAALNPRFSGAIDEFLFGLRFANWPDSPPPPPANLSGGPITGVWMGISMFGGLLKPGAAIFFSDGSAWFGSGFPTYGPHGIKPHIQRDADQRRWGTYRFQGGVGELRMPYGSIPLRLDGNALVLVTNNTPHRFIRTHGPRSGYLNGRYCYGDEPACLTLSTNGQFRDEGAVRVAEHATYPYPLSPEGGQGQYEIRDHTLILRYHGGPEVRIGYPGDENPAKAQDPASIVLSFNLDYLKKM
jgi:hypothetical protein